MLYVREQENIKAWQHILLSITLVSRKVMKDRTAAVQAMMDDLLDSLSPNGRQWLECQTRATHESHSDVELPG